VPSRIQKEDGSSNEEKVDCGAQIDLLFDRDDGSITVCEIKYTKTPFSIDKQCAGQLSQKLKVFKAVTRTKKQIFLSMISASGIKGTLYSEEMLASSIDLEVLFNKTPNN
jgi:hypothetical protein